ncbi:GDSL esterase/lipase [Striga hermonthica]|uniref:GDSL esterase/lipase n=1 Tax=Striga hermonthica TaxID=68872 RepID=A0A9N7MVC3_STRHE|nr:GDSL esterase/lipase [Striga hermonthica]
MATSFKSHTLACICIAPLLILLSFSTPKPANADKTHFKKIYAFGDSYTDTGNTRSNTGPSGFMFVSNPPYGSTYFRRPTNRYSDGRLVIDFVARALSLPFLPPYLDRATRASPSGLNFAVAGSTAIAHSFFVKNNLTLNITPQSLGTQLAWFEKFLEGKGCRDSYSTPAACEGLFGDTLIWVGEIGANDYAYSFGSTVTSETVQRLAITSVNAFLQAILKKGAKHVVVQGLPPTGCLTLSMYLAPPEDRDSTGCVGSANLQSQAHNTALKSRLDILRKQFPKSVIAYADYYNAYANIVKNPSKYGLREIYKACCGYGGGAYNFDYFHACGSPSSGSCANPSKFVNWDGVHLTEAMYRAVADAFMNGTYCQPTFRALLR